MLAISKEIKEAIESAERKNLILAFDDGTTIDNDDIALESMELEQSISEEETLRFGNINSACFKVKIKGTTKEYKNLWFNASLNVGGYTLPLGRFLVNSDKATSDRQYREVVAYDSLYSAMNTDVSEWYNGLTFPISINDMRNSLFDYLGIEQAEIELINDSYMVDKIIEGTAITGLMVMTAICELNAVFGVINAYGQFKYVKINNLAESGLFPSEDLYPSEDLFPQDIYDDRLSKTDYKLGSLTYEEFETQNITKVTIHEVENDLGISVGEDGNTYTIEDNFLVYGDTEENLTVVAQNIFDYAKHLTYTPASLKCNGKPWREVGDMIQVYANDRVFHTPIMNRVLSGIQALTDVYSSQGRETYEEQQETGYTAEIKKLKSRTNVLTRTIDETRSEITRVETEVNMNGRNFLRNTSEENVISALYQLYALVSSKDKLNGKKMVLSFDAFYSTEKELTLSFSFGTISNAKIYTMSETAVITGKETRYSVMLDTIEDFSDVKFLFIWANNYASSCTLKNVKLEIGEATDYSMAPEDISEKFENYSTTTEMDSAIKQSADNINLSVDEKLSNYSTTEQMNSAIDLKADSITLEVNKSIDNIQQHVQAVADDLANNYSTTIEMQAEIQLASDNITSTVSKTYETKSDADATKTSLQSQITQNADSIQSEVTRAENAESSLSSRITQTENSISSKVSKGSVSSEISQEADKIEITGDRFILNATNIQIDEDGNVTILGKLTTVTGSSIGGWETDGNSIFSGVWGASGGTPPDAFMCTGSKRSYKIGGSDQISGWLFGASNIFGVNKTEGMFINKGKVGGWTIGENVLGGDSTYILPTGKFAFQQSSTNYVVYVGGNFQLGSNTGLQMGSTVLSEAELKKLKALI